jgi:hypothetical protein
MLPVFTDKGDLPPGIHPAGWSEVEQRFGTGSLSRANAYSKLRHLHELAERTRRLERFLVFGSFVSTTADPRDIDAVLVMAPDFRLEEAPRESLTLFSHPDAEARFGASIFWIRQGMLQEAQMQEFLETWQTKRDGTRRGLLEVRP